MTVDREMCLGKANCQMCLEACPYESPQFGFEGNARMQKCDLRVDRWADGKKPVCVDGCPMWALDVGALDELGAKYCDAT